jgi:hypothetical protein
MVASPERWHHGDRLFCIEGDWVFRLAVSYRSLADGSVRFAQRMGPIIRFAMQIQLK